MDIYYDYDNIEDSTMYKLTIKIKDKFIDCNKKI